MMLSLNLWLAIGGAIVALAIIFAIYRAGRKSARADHLEDYHAQVEQDMDAVARSRRARRDAERGELLDDDGFRRD